MTSPRPFFRSQLEWAVLFVLTAVLGSAWIFISREPIDLPRDPISLTEAPMVGFQAPNFTLRTPLGETVTLADYQGQPVVLNFWASWCGPCRIEMPHLQSASLKYNGRSAVIGVNQGEAPRTVTDFGNEFAISYPLLVDQDSAVNRTYLVNSLPTTIFIDSEGVVREILIGTLTQAVLEDRIERLLAEQLSTN